MLLTPIEEEHVHDFGDDDYIEDIRESDTEAVDEDAVSDAQKKKKKLKIAAERAAKEADRLTKAALVAVRDLQKMDRAAREARAIAELLAKRAEEDAYAERRRNNINKVVNSPVRNYEGQVSNDAGVSYTHHLNQYAHDQKISSLRPVVALERYRPPTTATAHPNPLVSIFSRWIIRVIVTLLV